jgi:uncharacterized membrane protein
VAASRQYDCVPSPIERVARAFFTSLALAVLCLPLLSLALNYRVRWGTVPEWIAAFALLFIGAGIWKIARSSEPRRHYSDVAKESRGR